MPTNATAVNTPQILKQIWEEDLYNYFYEEAALIAHLGKETTWDGLYDNVTLQYGGMAGRSHTFSEAQNAKSPTKFAQMNVAVRENYALWSVDHMLITLSRNSRGALVRALANNTEAAVAKLKRSSCWGLWRNGGGAIGKISAISTNTFTFTDINDIRNVDIDDVLVLSADDGTGGAGLRNSGASVIVTGLNEDTGVVTCNAGIVATIAAAALGDFVFHKGDYNLAFAGIPAYVTLNAPGVTALGTTTPANIWNMVRTDFPTRKAGHRFAGTVATCVSDLQDALMKCFRRNVKITHVFVPPEIHKAIEISLGANRRYVDDNVGSVGFKALEFTVQGGKTVKVYSDADIPKSPDGTKTLVFGLNMDTWTFKTADEYPMWLTQVAGGGAQKFMLHASENASEGRLGGYGNAFTNAPGQNFVLILS